jgi:hypothetical protein
MPTDRVCTPQGWCWKYPKIGDWLEAVWGTSDTDVWMAASGDLEWNGFGNGNTRGVYHFDGTNWTGLVQGFGDRAELVPSGSSIAGSSPTDVWVASNAYGIYHYDGDHWTKVSHDVVPPVHAASATEAWAASREPGHVMHWNGKEWTEVAVPLSGAPTAIWAFSSKDVWIGNAAAVYHWDGLSWSLQSPNPAESGPSAGCRSLWGADPQNLFCLGAAPTVVGGAKSWLYRYGPEWTPLGTDHSNLILSSSQDPPDFYYPFFLTGTDAAHVVGIASATVAGLSSFVTLGGTRSGFSAYEWRGSFNSVASDPPGLTAAWASPSGKVFAVGARDDMGGENSVFGGSPVGPVAIFDLNQSASSSDWAPPFPEGIFEPRCPGAVSQMTFVAENDAWFVKGTNVITHYDGSSFQQYPVPPTPPFVSISAAGSKDVWAVGTGGAAHWDGTKWTRSTVGSTGMTLTSVWARTASDVWTLGADGHAFEYDGAQWKDTGTASAFSLPPVAITGSSQPNDVWVGCSHFDGTWHATTMPDLLGSGSPCPIYSSPYPQLQVRAISPTSAIALIMNGDHAVLIRWNGTLWSAIPDSTFDNLGHGLIAGTWVSDTDVVLIDEVRSAVRWNGSRWVDLGALPGEPNDNPIGLAVAPGGNLIAYGPDEVLPLLLDYRP